MTELQDSVLLDSDAKNSSREDAPNSLGQLLAFYRQQKAIPLDEISDRLKLSIEQIGYIENNEWSHFHQVQALKGFVKNYARLLEINVTDRLTEIDSFFIKPSLDAVATVGTPLPKYKERRWMVESSPSMRWVKWFIVTLFLVLCAGLIWVLLNSGVLRDNTTDTDAISSLNTVTGMSSPTPESVTQLTLPSSDSQPVSNPSVSDSLNNHSSTSTLPISLSTPSDGASATVTNSPSVSPNVGVSSASTAVPVQPLNPPSSPVVVAPVTTPSVETVPETRSDAASSSVSSNHANDLKIVAQEDSWVRVRDAKGIVFSGVIVAGKTQTIEGVAPFDLEVGNSLKTQVFWRGALFNLDPYRRNNVARFRLEK